jgi:hypothetical protein
MNSYIQTYVIDPVNKHENANTKGKIFFRAKDDVDNTYHSKQGSSHTKHKQRLLNASSSHVSSRYHNKLHIPFFLECEKDELDASLEKSQVKHFFAMGGRNVIVVPVPDKLQKVNPGKKTVCMFQVPGIEVMPNAFLDI